MRILMRTVLAVLAVFLLQSLGVAGTLMVASSGIFSSGAPSTTWSAPNASWSFSFNVSDTPVPVSGSDDSFGFDVPFSNFTYTLAGGDVVTTPLRIRFWSSPGILDVYFLEQSSPPVSDDLPATGFDIMGAPAFSGTSSTPTILAGSYPASGAMFYHGGAAADFFEAVTVNIAAPPVDSSVPEPATLTMVGAGFCLLGWIRRSRKVS
jgi:hypothetical protein